MDNERLAKLQEAILTIKEECNKHTYCNECPLRTSNNNCYITKHSEHPEYWNVSTEPIIPAPKLFS